MNNTLKLKFAVKNYEIRNLFSCKDPDNKHYQKYKDLLVKGKLKKLFSLNNEDLDKKININLMTSDLKEFYESKTKTFINDNTIKSLLLRLAGGSRSDTVFNFKSQEYFKYSLKEFFEYMAKKEALKKQFISLLSEEDNLEKAILLIKQNKKNNEAFLKLKQENLVEGEYFYFYKDVFKYLKEKASLTKKDLYDQLNLIEENIKTFKNHVETLANELNLSVLKNDPLNQIINKINIKKFEIIEPAFKKTKIRTRKEVPTDSAGSSLVCGYFDRDVYTNIFLYKKGGEYENLKNIELIFNEFNSSNFPEFIKLLSKKEINFEELNNYILNNFKNYSDFNLLKCNDKSSKKLELILKENLIFDDFKETYDIFVKKIFNETPNKTLNNYYVAILYLFYFKMVLSKYLNNEGINISNIVLNEEKIVYFKENIKYDSCKTVFNLKGMAPVSCAITPKDFFKKDRLKMIEYNAPEEISIVSGILEVEVEMNEDTKNIFKTLMDLNGIKYIQFKSKGFAELLSKKFEVEKTNVKENENVIMGEW